MSSIQRRKFKSVTTYRVQVRRLGFKSLSKSFATLTEAKKWCRTMEAKFDLPTVQLMSGHKNPSVLLKVYTKLDPEKLVATIG